MTDVLERPRPPVERAICLPSIASPRSRLAVELREVAADLAGCLDRDELTIDEEACLSEVLDASVAAVLPRVRQLLGDELDARLDSMPLHVRARLASAHQRRELGID